MSDGNKQALNSEAFAEAQIYHVEGLTFGGHRVVKVETFKSFTVDDAKQRAQLQATMWQQAVNLYRNFPSTSEDTEFIYHFEPT